MSHDRLIKQLVALLAALKFEQSPSAADAGCASDERLVILT